MNEVVIPLKIQGIAQMKAELRELKGSIASATDPAQMAALAQQAGVLSDKIKDANDAVKVFATGSKFEQVSNGLGGIKDSLMSLDFEEAAEKSKTFATALGGINPADIGKAMTGLVTTVGTLGKAFLKLGAQLLVNPIFLMVAIVVAVVLAFTIWEDKLGKFGIVLKVAFAGIYLMVEAVKLLIQGFKDMTDWLGLTSFAAEDNAEKTAAANKKINESSKAREAKVVGALGREIAELKAAGEDTTKQEEAVSNTKIKEANKRKEAAKKELDDIKKLDGKFYEDKRLELKKQVDAENDIIKQANSDKVVAKNAANKKEVDDLKAKTDSDNKEAAAKQKAANDKYAAADKASMDQIAAARKIVTDSAKTAQQIEIDDLAAAYKIKIAEANKYKNDTTALVNAQKIQEAAINKKYDDEAKAKTAANMASSHAANIAKIDAYNARLSELTDTEEQKLYDKYAADLITFEDNELALFNIKKKYEEDITALKKTEADKQKAITDKARAEEMATIKGGLDTATDALNSINSLASIGIEAKLKNVKKGSKEEEKILRAQFKQQKAMQLAMAAINGAQAILAILTVPDFTLGIASGIRIAAAVTATAASIATIAGTQFGGGASAPATPDVGGAGTSTTAVAPAAAPQLFGQANTGSQVNAGGGSNNITVTAVVSETEITASQNHINNIQNNSVL
jgi:hypothetical protein